eukprot:SAG11_NODE_135_length_15131_cov_9.906599_1_plen_74_part_00
MQSLQACIELGEAADEADFEAATNAYQFRDYKGGMPEIVTVRIRPDGKYVSVRESGGGLTSSIRGTISHRPRS